MSKYCAIPGCIIGFGPRGTMGGVGYFSRINKRATIKSKIVIPYETCVILNGADIRGANRYQLHRGVKPQ